MKKLVVVLLGALLSLTCACGESAGDVSKSVSDTAATHAAVTDTVVTDSAVTDRAVPDAAVTDVAATDMSSPEATAAMTAMPADTEKPEPAKTLDKPGTTEAVSTESTPPAVELPAETNPPAAETTGTEKDAKTTAMNYIGQSVSALHAAIGYPSYSDYAPSCLGDGEDGNLYYDGFVVYTYKEGESETINYVE